MKAALEELEAGGSLRTIGARYDIPHNTLQDHRRGRYTYQPHPSRALLPEEEASLVTYIIWMGRHGFPVTRAVATLMATGIVKASGRQTMVNFEHGLSRMWWCHFRERHPELSARTPDSLDRQRVFGVTVPRVEALFNILEPMFGEKSWHDRPHLVFNCDETGFGDKQKSRKEKVYAQRGQKHVYRQTVLTREHISVHCCASAAGVSIPPMIIYAQCLPSNSYALDGPPNALYAISEKGYMDGPLFVRWIEHFLKHAPAERPLLLTCDQHETHMSKDVVDLCRGNGVEVVCLPSHTTHALQPLDVSLFGPLKEAFTKLATNMGLVRGDLVLGKKHFSSIIKFAYPKAATVENIKKGFRLTGLFPLNRHALEDSDQMMIIPPVSVHPAPPSTTIATAQIHPAPLGTTIATAQIHPAPPGTTIATAQIHPAPPGTSIATAQIHPAPPGTSIATAQIHPAPPGTTIATAQIHPAPPGTTIATAQFHQAPPGTTIAMAPPDIISVPVVAGCVECPTCHRPPNPLVAAGIIPEGLAHILVPPRFDQSARRRRQQVPAGARCITSDEFAAHQAEKEREETEKQEAKRRRMEEVKERRALMEEEKKRKQREREQREREKEQRERERERGKEQREREKQREREQERERLHREREQERLQKDICAACKQPSPPGSATEIVEWVECENCTLWYHTECVAHVVPEEAWLCRECAMSHDM
ncbi:hypothetical protein R3I93_016388 [Phoxinus phoxinus]|uniref:HTH CENPB-type domain-containing protein n=1 Tax=Phoxinus phoxinus TaxID=58324 RepID=A0AAN9CJF4_9TELE